MSNLSLKIGIMEIEIVNLYSFDKINYKMNRNNKINKNRKLPS
jgi:hypothetical protein